MKRRQFINTCTCCAFLGAGALLLNKDNIAIKFGPESDFMVNHVEIHIAEHCNLNCKYCCHFSPIAQKEFYDLDKYKQDVKRMAKVFNRQLLDMQILGGEPLLNPQINEYVKYARKCLPKTRIGILTNATLLDDMDEKFWKTLNENNINIMPTIYPVKINWASILDKAKKYNIDVYANFTYKEKLTLDNIKNYRKDIFSRMKLTENEYNHTIDKSACQRKFGCNAMYDGKFYPCFSIAYIRHINKKFGTNFKVTKDDYLDLYKASGLADVKDFLGKAQYPFCNYCIVDSGKVKWENSATHGRSEWM